MKNRWLINLVLVAVIASLAALVITKPGKKEEPVAPPLTPLKANDITRIQLDRPTRKSLLLIKVEKQWQLSRPIKARANRFNVSNLLRLAETKSEASFPADPAELEKYGLKKPQVKLLLNKTELQFGNKHPLKSSRYVLFDNKVYLVPAHLLRMTKNPYTDFISGRLLEGSRPLKAIKFSKLKLTKKESGWSMTPEDKNLSADDINDYIEEWKHANALSVDRYSGKPVLETVHLEFVGANNKEESLNLGILAYAPEFILYRRDENLEYRFPEETGKRLLKPVSK
ncbi:MAG: hypothetical protein BMS9Abin33_0897 [Gammaproteobacteria bacterium]|nr:MAG: hypothetical protein BMS9Abin33_0897 [Gammaproteobacteria bacterium]